MVLMTPFNIPYTLPSFVAKKNSLQLNVTVLLAVLEGFDALERLLARGFWVNKSLCLRD
jgi:hypothetical protein